MGLTAVDDDVKVWVAARTAALSKQEFSAQDVLDALHHVFQVDGKKMERFVTQQCVANAPGGAGKHYNYLFKVGPNRYRMWRSGDPIEYTHASAPTSPEVHRVPADHRSLFTTRRSHESLKPAEPAHPVHGEKQADKHEKHRAGARGSAHAVLETSGHHSPSTKGLKIDMAELDATAPAGIARRTIFDLLFLEFGRVGSRLETKQGDAKGETFLIQHEKVVGTVKTLQNFTTLMPSGGLISHQADVLVELESPTRVLFIDVLEASTRPDEMKAHGFDALHIRKDKKERHSVLVFLRTPNGMLQEQAESIAYGYDFFFGADANDAKSGNKFYALKSHVVDWLNGKIKPRAGA